MSERVAAARAAAGWLPFRVAILAVVVGLLVVTCGFLLLFALHRGQRPVEILKGEYLDQVAEMTAREVTRLPRVATPVLHVQRRQIEAGVYSAADPTLMARALAGALEADHRIKWVSYSEDGPVLRIPRASRSAGRAGASPR
jgi:hypothetical protein